MSIATSGGRPASGCATGTPCQGATFDHVSPRARILLLVGLAAVLAVAAVVAGAVLLGDETPEAADAPATTGNDAAEPEEADAPALELAVIDRDDEDAAALRRGEFLYEDGEPDEARASFESVLANDPGSIEAAIGAAYSDWPDGT